MKTMLCLIVAGLSCVTGCGSIRVVSEAKTGGTIVLEGAHDSARAKAERYMREQCPAGYEVVEEGDTAGDSDGDREWRIAYRCTGTTTARVARIAL